MLVMFVNKAFYPILSENRRMVLAISCQAYEVDKSWMLEH
jgi:hypothetical protein